MSDPVKESLVGNQDRLFNTIMWRLNSIIVLNAFVAALDCVILSNNSLLLKMFATSSLSTAVISSVAAYAAYKKIGNSYTYNIERLLANIQLNKDTEKKMIENAKVQVFNAARDTDSAEKIMVLHICIAFILLMTVSYGCK